MDVSGSSDRTLLIGGRIYDGSGCEPYVGDVLISGERILDVAPSIDAAHAERVDVTGRDIMPGFIDVHSHDDAALLRPGALDPKVRQGVTTTVIGNCGHGCAPSSSDSGLEDYSTPVLGPLPAHRWSAFADYLAEVASAPRRINSLALVPHAPIRSAAIGMIGRPADSGERDRISTLVRDALDAGAAGVSFGLMYSPGNAADSAELEAIGTAVASRGGVLAAHVRNEADALLASLEEVATIARVTGVALHVSHLKVTGPRNFGRMPEVIDRLDSYRSQGIDVTADVYPYDAGSTTVATLFPSWATDRGVTTLLAALTNPALRGRLLNELRQPWAESPLENYFASLGPDAILLGGFRSPDLLLHDGKSIAAIADHRGQEPAECLADLVLAEHGNLTVVLFQTDIHGMQAALAWPWTLIGSDGLPSESGYVHPRLYGTFPRLLTAFAGDGKPISRTEAVKRATRDSAHRFGIRDRGAIRPGAIADLQVLDPRSYADRSSFQSPRRSPSGLDEVFVRGQRALSGARGGNFGRFLPSTAAGSTL